MPVEQRFKDMCLIPLVTIAFFLATDFAIVRYSLPTPSESSQFVFASPTTEQHMLKPLASFEKKVLENRTKRFLKASLKVRMRQDLKVTLYKQKATKGLNNI